ncbi:MAG: membrane protein insertion efficiency factor YidD [Sphaerochaetaceae bacterium]|nr:membrane protein insertion efficiency factor YidD [Sphaerochaetaceae bacterium]
MNKDVARKIYLIPVKGYQKFLSPFLGKDCLYSPTCSHYFCQAVMKHGILKGTTLGVARILRCNRLYYGGIDEVPEVFSFKAIHDKKVSFRRHGKDLL